MSVETHNVTPDDVLAGLPMASGQVTQSSDGLSTDDLDRYIRRGAGRLNAILEGRDIDPANLDEYPNFRETVRIGIIAYAQLKALEHHGYGGDDAQIERLQKEWDDIRDTLRNRDRDAGESHDGEAAVRSNVDTSSDKTSTTWGSTYDP